ncbi:MAG: hypothetical protein LBU23_10965 [Planctomycetota bacterium]|jgi:hypothetical protein|nr:hypothetical protein [Planctomycetota bacterium]
MPKYLVHYRPACASEDIRAVVEAPSYRAAIAQLRYEEDDDVTVYSIKPSTAEDVEAAAKGASNG